MTELSFFECVSVKVYLFYFQKMKYMTISAISLFTMLASIWSAQCTRVLADCPIGCTCERMVVNCKSVIPARVPTNTTEVIVSQINLTLLVPRTFCNVSWPSVKRLELVYFDETAASFNLDDYVFICLNKIERIHLNISQLSNLSFSTFYGLQEVLELDFSGSTRLTTPAIVPAISSDTVLPKLSKLLLCGTGTYLGGIEISQDLINALAPKNITELNLSSTAISLNQPDFEGLCDTLEVFNLSNTILDYSSSFVARNVCSSLRIIDVSEIRPARTKIPPHTFLFVNQTITLDWNLFLLFGHASVLYANRVLSADHIFNFINSTLTISVETLFTDMYLSGYTVPSFDLQIHHKYLKYLDLSHNNIEHIGTLTFKYLKQLTAVDLSYNKLAETNKFDDTFSKLFASNPNLEAINLQNNGLRCLPVRTFSQNPHLKWLCLSGNSLKQVTFSILHMTNLAILDMADNSIERFNKASRNSLDKLYEMQQKARNGTSSTLSIDLRGNTFACNCDSLSFTLWFDSSPVMASTKHLYYCEVNGQRKHMNNEAIKAARGECERPIRKRRMLLLSTTIPCGVAVVVAATIFIVIKRHRKKMFYHHLENQADRLHDDNIGFRFPVFLSYASLDSAFVVANVLNPLQVYLLPLMFEINIARSTSFGKSFFA